MKKLILLFIGLITGMVLINLSCSKTINGRTDNLAPLAPLKTDIDAGAWKTIGRADRLSRCCP